MYTLNVVSKVVTLSTAGNRSVPISVGVILVQDVLNEITSIPNPVANRRDFNFTVN